MAFDFAAFLALVGLGFLVLFAFLGFFAFCAFFTFFRVFVFFVVVGGAVVSCMTEDSVNPRPATMSAATLSFARVVSSGSSVVCSSVPSRRARPPVKAHKAATMMATRVNFILAPKS
ncbi:hypothetical protein H257_01178 [Aphanomyces astaci]|uniref:Uncharacterized protein n=1 Tax=Aphanomyces astaci TaxID=112090 RepID=W4H6P6_APHAT|nr:hypothetical protein H257_01178 [Aphanomyces astaci]ETV87695.1 hypothetical protein H257_01178 [Aphanomyces astaci]|eukprot:XP_009822558.1 hypothetical protein H257_01178 [Aphanomyces astaci]